MDRYPTPERDGDFPRFHGAFLEAKKNSRLEHEPTEDVVLFDADNGIFGIFDGMGGMSGRPDLAAQIAARTIAKSLKQADLSWTTLPYGPPMTESLNDARMSIDDVMSGYMRMALAEANDAVLFEDGARAGSTTATAAWYVEHPARGPGLVFGNAGDSRSFLYNKVADRYWSITKNQGYRNVVENGLGMPHKNYRDDQAFFWPLYDYEAANSEQPFYASDPSQWRLMICSDGITGDLPEEFLTEEEFMSAFHEERPLDAARVFIDASKKDDDKSIIVVDFA